MSAAANDLREQLSWQQQLQVRLIDTSNRVWLRELLPTAQPFDVRSCDHLVNVYSQLTPTRMKHIPAPTNTGTDFKTEP
jgi:hypothetical protein